MRRLSLLVLIASVLLRAGLRLSRDAEPAAPAAPAPRPGHHLGWAFADDPRARPIPQDPDRQRRRADQRYERLRGALAGAYDRLGRLDPRWDGPARVALEALARIDGRLPDPDTPWSQVHAPALQAVEAGCDDPLVLHAYARSSAGPDDPGPEELDRRHRAAASAALTHGAYPPLRPASVLVAFATHRAGMAGLDAGRRCEATAALEMARALLARSIEEDAQDAFIRQDWYDLARAILLADRGLGGDPEEAARRLDVVLAGDPALAALRGRFRGEALIESAWEARGGGVAGTVGPRAAALFRERLAGARDALAASWGQDPTDGGTAALMVIVEKGIGGDRDAMEAWFARAMQADGDTRRACSQKLDWLDPKWHGDADAMIAFGRACRDTENWRAGIPLLLAEAHWRASRRLPEAEQGRYFEAMEVWGEVRAVYRAYLEHYPNDHAARSRYAAYCCLGGWLREAHAQFEVLGEDLVGDRDFPEAWMAEARALAARDGGA